MRVTVFRLGLEDELEVVGREAPVEGGALLGLLQPLKGAALGSGQGGQGGAVFLFDLVGGDGHTSDTLVTVPGFYSSVRQRSDPACSVGDPLAQTVIKRDGKHAATLSKVRNRCGI